MVLSTDGLMEIVFLTYGKGVKDKLWLPVAGGPVESLPFLDDLMETSDDFL